MLILGIDPGTVITGYGIIEVGNGEIQAIDYGCIKPNANAKLTDRYLFIYNGLEELLERYKPQALAVETQFVSKNPQSALKLGMARGIIIVAAKKRGIPVFEYAPTKAKLAISGNGRASKSQVQKMVQLLLKLAKVPTPEDAADALAIAVCHANSIRYHNYQLMEI